MRSPPLLTLTNLRQLTFQKTITMSAFTNTNKFYMLSLGISLHSAIEGVADWRSGFLGMRNAIGLFGDEECDRAFWGWGVRSGFLGMRNAIAIILRKFAIL